MTNGLELTDNARVVRFAYILILVVSGHVALCACLTLTDFLTVRRKGGELSFLPDRLKFLFDDF